MDIKIGDKVELRNPFSNEFGEYEFVSIHESGDYIFKGEGLTTQVISEQCLRYLGINKKVNNMNFIEAVKLLKLDKNIKLRRRSKNSNFELTFCIINFQRMVKIEDILAEDWYVVKDEKLHTFEEALEALKNGAKIYRKSCATQVHRKTDRQFLFYNYDDFEANDWIIKERN